MDDDNNREDNNSNFDDISLRKQMSRREFNQLDFVVTNMVQDIHKFIRKHVYDELLEDRQDLKKYGNTMEAIYDQSNNNYYGLKQDDYLQVIEKAITTKRNASSNIEHDKLLNMLDGFLEQINTLEIKLKMMHQVKQNHLLVFLQKLNVKLTTFRNKIGVVSKISKIDKNNESKKNIVKKFTDFNAIANCESPLIKNKMLEFETHLINNNIFQSKDKKGLDNLKLINLKVEMVKKLNKGLKKFQKKFDNSMKLSDQVDQSKHQVKELNNNRDSTPQPQSKSVIYDFRRRVSSVRFENVDSVRARDSHNGKEVNQSQENELFVYQKRVNDTIVGKLTGLQRSQNKFERLKDLNHKIKDDLFVKHKNSKRALKIMPKALGIKNE